MPVLLYLPSRGLSVHKQKHRPSGNSSTNGPNVSILDAHFANQCVFSDARGQNI